MKYVVIHNLGSLKSAFVFDSHNEATDYIDACSKCIKKEIKTISKIDENSYVIELKNGRVVKAFIEKYPNNRIKHEVSCSTKGRHIDNHKFTNRQSAVDFATRIASNLGYVTGEKERKLGEWTINNPGENLEAHIDINLIILSKKESSDYDMLDVEYTASMNEIKRAYRKMVLKYHPDHGGDAEQFKKLQESYERILNGTAQVKKQTRLESFYSIDMRYFFKFHKILKKEFQNNSQVKAKPEFERTRTIANDLFTYGWIVTMFGAVLFGMTYDSTSPLGISTIFAIASSVGLIVSLCGLYRLFSSKSSKKESKKKFSKSKKNKSKAKNKIQRKTRA